ncbi:DUF4197 domain-containing protein [Aequorivita sp. CIP111184]|uniref:DUF4197 domain-containing protein n=1 Tax=Aequorivita sp. CIP111184 TaxID=2211356 RepID=UPI000DBBD0B2|nr:DUF4197 domain-containing protein [Aequorivita sp. CIP111184]SRX53998.1 hypothetical protein AEQU1_01049 [Aequorivita sp. CIP111184]
MLLKKLFLFCSVFMLFSCAELQQVVNTLPNQTGIGTDPTMIANGLRQALDFGIEKQVTKLTQTDGFYKNQLVKILLPEELQKVDQTLRDIGLGSLADEGIKALNRAAEDAVKEATPIFVNAVKQITFSDAKNILLGPDNAATNYLEQRTNTELYSKFNPVIKKSFSKVGADQVWSNIITKYNSVPFVTRVNPDLTDYVTNEALNGVYKMISVEEKDIRNNLSARTTTLLRQVFALQD